MNPFIQEVSLDALVRRIADDLTQIITETLKSRSRFTWVLSGGTTPRKLFTLLAGEPYRSAIPWTKLWIFWGDERTVPPDHADSNYRMARETLLARVPIPTDQIFRLQGELPPEKAAHDYEKQLRDVFGSAVSFPAFDLVLLGLGPDGHTASLFPGTAGLTVNDRWVIANPVPAMNTVRLTLSLPVLNHACRIWFMATGADKAAAFARARAAPDPATPASLVRPVAGDLRWYVDDAILK